jgi:hypothetical protein
MKQVELPYLAARLIGKVREEREVHVPAFLPFQVAIPAERASEVAVTRRLDPGSSRRIRAGFNTVPVSLISSYEVRNVFDSFHSQAAILRSILKRSARLW